MTEPDPWTHVRRFTPARIALGRAGGALPTREVLRFGLAHAQARDAVHAALDVEALRAELAALGVAPLVVESAAPDRPTYLARPDLGRRLSDRSREGLAAADRCGIAIVIADGLSATAIQRHAGTLVSLLLPAHPGESREPEAGMGPGFRRDERVQVVIATQARVALGDEVGALLGAEIVVVLIGERPGLSAPDGIGAYVTFGPRPGRTDADRNCVSNIRPEGLPLDEAALKIRWLLAQACTRGLTGVALKDESDRALLKGAGARGIAAEP